MTAMAASVRRPVANVDMGAKTNGRAARHAGQLYSLVPGVSHHRGDRLDERHALFAAPVRLSHRGGAGFGKLGTFQGNGTPVDPGDHESLHDSGLDSGPIAGLADRRIHGSLVAHQISAGADPERTAWLFCR